MVELIPASNHHTDRPTNPAWPFLYYGDAVLAVTARSAGMATADIHGSIHAFTGPLMDGGRVIVTAEDRAQSIKTAIVSALDVRGLSWGSEGERATLRCDWSKAMKDRDTEDALHVIVRFVARVIAKAL